ncbi:FAD-dependent oxidoreductase [Pseudonocardia eucalypti]|uniref:FAD-dependent oxidoreductase n=1 Tax=Pseudonocardia eucalypti TaxID=648755 RepID=A0ABP9QJU3_9PSEU|nr:2-polyprenyl-6-methoxyphenol hydroxylase-like FAD-dependent oxidoreductase [Pseudonocardia eucalypti]
MTDETEVLVVGAGPVGLTLAITLGQRGIRTVLIERNPTPGILPKMDLANARSMEIFGRLHLADRIRAAGWPLDAPFDVYAGPSLTEPPYAVLSYPSILESRRHAEEGVPGVHPREPYERISQYTLERLLGDAARALPGVDVLFAHQLVDFRQDADAMHATIQTPDGERSAVTASYLVGADGGNSLVRNTLEINYSGPGDAARHVLIFFRAPALFEKAGLEPFRHYYLAGERHGILIAQDDLTHFALHLEAEPGTDTARLDAAEEVHAALGIGLDIEVLHLGAWTARLVVADQYRAGRVFLAGDSAHQYIPTGGFGLNTGIGDADNLAWKLAATLRGWGGPALLDSYHDERHPVGHRNCRASEYAAVGVRQWRSHYDPSVTQDTAAGRENRRLLAAAFNTYQRRSHEQQGTELGYRYSLSGVIAHEPGPLPDPDSPVYVPSSTAGSRLPHAWIEPGVSVHDRVGFGLTLLAIDAPPELTNAFTDADRRGIPLDVVRVNGRADLRELYGAPLLLIRPDMHIAWRGDGADAADAVLALCAGRGGVIDDERQPAGPRT